MFNVQFLCQIFTGLLVSRQFVYQHKIYLDDDASFVCFIYFHQDLAPLPWNSGRMKTELTAKGVDEKTVEVSIVTGGRWMWMTSFTRSRLPL